MKMKAKNIVLSFLGSAAFVCLSLGVTLTAGNSVEAQAAQATIFESPGASIRMNKQDGLNGIRFPMFMDNDTFNSLTSNATIKSEDVTFGTLIIPTDKLTGTLNVNTPLAKNLVTYGYNENDEFVNVWTECTDEDYPDCMQGYAYIHSIPDTSLDRNLTAVGYYTTDGGASYTYTTPIERHVSYVADAAIKSGDYSATQITVLEEFLANYTITFEGKSETTTQTVKYGKTYTLPAISITAPADSMLDWYEKVGEGYDIVDLSQGGVTALKNTQYALRAGESVTYTTTLQNKENIYGSDPCVTYKDGYYYYVYFDSKQKVYVLKSPSLEDILDGSYSGWGDSTATCVYDPNGTTGNENSAMAEGIWAPELQYIQGKWYIYLSGRAKGTSSAEDERMFVLECKSQDPTGEYEAPVQLCPSGFSGRYAIDGHVFEYNGQLYYTFSGQKWTDTRPRIYICTMSSPTSVNNDAVNISQGSSLEEGPCTIVDGNDLYLMYSVGDYNGVNYRVKYYKLTGGTNPLTKSDWTAMEECLQADSNVDIHCTGHNHIFKDANGQIWTSYHGVVGTDGAGTDTYLSNRRVMVQPISVVDGALNFGGVQDTVTITDQDGLYYANSQKTEYYVNGEGSGRLWKNNGRTFTVSTTITRLTNERDYCAGITLYERKGDGTFNRLLIGVEEEGNLFLCKDYARTAYKYKYVGWQWDNQGKVNLTVNYNANDKTLKIDIYKDGQATPWTKTYTLDQINAIVSDKVGEESKAFNLNFTGDFEIGLGGNKGKCKFTNVLFAFEKFDVTFIDAFGNKTTQKVEYGKTFEAPTFAEREGFEFVGWAEKIGDDMYGEPGEIADLTVNGNREFKAVYEAVGPTYESPAMESTLYSGTTVFEVNAEQASFKSNDVGTYFFEGVELAQDENFVMYATIKSGFATNIGFVVGTLESTSKHLLFQWRANDIYLWRNISWTGHEDNQYKPGYGNNSSDVEIALVYKDGYYMMFMNGVNVLTLAETTNTGWGCVINTAIGTTGTKKIGLSLFNGTMNATEWGYSTDASAIAEYTEVNPGMTSKLYSGASATVTATQATISSSDVATYFFNGVELAQDQNFVMYATIKSGFTGSIGFVVGTLAETKNHLLFHWRANDIYLWRNISWAGHEDNKYKPGYGNNSSDVNIALVYVDGYYSMYMNGKKVFMSVETADIGWGTKPQSCIGTTGTKKIGLSLYNGKMTATEWGYTTDAAVIAEYTKDKPGMTSKLYSGASATVTATQATLTSSDCGAYFFNGVELAQNQNFVMYATIKSGFTGSIGFVVGTLAANSNHLLFQWRANDIYLWRNISWTGHEDNKYTPGYGNNSSDVSIALMYKDGYYSMYMNGARVLNLAETTNTGWGCVLNTAIGTSGTKKIGLSIFNGTLNATEWGYSTNEADFEKYIHNKPSMESKLYDGSSMSVNTAGSATLTTSSNNCGTWFFQGAEMAQNQNFVMYATIKSGFTGQIGFVVGTLAETKNHLLFQWRANDIYLWRSISWTGHADDQYKPGYGNNSSDVKIALVYKDGYYSMYMNGTKVFNCKETSDIGWGTKPQNCIGATGTKKIGLSSYNGKMTVSNWGYSTDASVIAQYA